MAQAFGIGKAAHHNGKRLVAAALATAQLDHRLLIGGVAGRWNPPSPLMATIPPLASSSTQRSIMASLVSRVLPTAGIAPEPSSSMSPAASRQVICGPQSKQASGCA